MRTERQRDGFERDLEQTMAADEDKKAVGRSLRFYGSVAW